jgi:CBS-domain-containing membrane protein
MAPAFSGASHSSAPMGMSFYTEHAETRRMSMAVVGETRNLIGCVTSAEVKAIPKEEWDRRTVSEVVKPCSGANTVGPDTDALNALSKIRETGSAGLLVTERNHLLAIISPRDVLNFLAAKMDIEGKSASGLLAEPQA